MKGGTPIFPIAVIFLIELFPLRYILFFLEKVSSCRGIMSHPQRTEIFVIICSPPFKRTKNFRQRFFLSLLYEVI